MGGRPANKWQREILVPQCPKQGSVFPPDSLSQKATSDVAVQTLGFEVRHPWLYA